MSSHAHPWEYPDCPDCGTNLYVDGRKGKGPGNYICHKCGVFRV